MAINKQIKGSNLCETSCIEKKNVIHPETCVNQVLIDDSSEKTLREWILNAEEPATLGTYRCLKNWLLINYPVSGEPQDIPHADSTHYGVIKTGEGNQYLTLNDGVLTFNYSELPQLQYATYNSLGGIKLGNSGTVTGAFNHNQNYSNIPYPTGSFSNFYGFPLSLDANNRAGVVIPQELFSGRVQSDWNTSDNTDSSYIRNKPSLAAVATSGSYNDLTNKPTIPAAQIQSDWNQTNNTSIDYIKNKPSFSKHETKVIYTILPEDFVRITGIMETIEDEIESGLGNTKEINLNIVGPLTPEEANSQDIPYVNNLILLIEAIEDVARQVLVDQNLYTNMKINIRFTFNDDVRFDFRLTPLTGYSNLSNVAIKADTQEMGFNDTTNTCTITCSAYKECNISMNYIITKAYLNPNNTDRLYSTILEYTMKNYIYNNL